MARVVRWVQSLQVNAISILRRGDLVNRDHGKVDIFAVLDPASPTGSGGPSIPEPVVHPLPAAALRTKPMAAS